MRNRCSQLDTAPHPPLLTISSASTTNCLLPHKHTHTHTYCLLGNTDILSTDFFMWTYGTRSPACGHFTGRCPSPLASLRLHILLLSQHLIWSDVTSSFVSLHFSWSDMTTCTHSLALWLKKTSCQRVSPLKPYLVVTLWMKHIPAILVPNFTIWNTEFNQST